MSRDEACPGMRRLVDRHFALQINSADEQIMRTHLPMCQACQDYYQRHLMVAELDPKSHNQMDRLAQGLGLRPAPRRRLWLAVPVGVVAAVAAALFGLLWLEPGQERIPSGLASRGGENGQPTCRLLMYRVVPGKTPVLAGDEIQPADELAFAYQNACGKKYLLVFGVDDLQNIYWYYPSWQEERQNPGAIAIEPGESIHELPEAVSQELKGTTLDLIGVFVDSPYTVREIEDVVRRMDPREDVLPLGDMVKIVVRLRIGH